MWLYVWCVRTLNTFFILFLKFESLFNHLDACASGYCLNSKTTVAALLFSLVGYGTGNPHDNPAKPHHVPGSFDLALIAVGAYQPRWFIKEQHANLAKAVQTLWDLKARHRAGIHQGAFSLIDELLHRPPIDLGLAARERGQNEDAFTVMAISETRVPPARATP